MLKPHYFYLKITFESLHPISSHAIAQTLNGFISKCKFDKIAAISEHVKKLSFR